MLSIMPCTIKMTSKDHLHIIRSHTKLVLTNGVFDILHSGHIELLYKAKTAFGLTSLVVALNTDESAKKYKGPKRPCNGYMERAMVLAALEMVDYVIPMADENASELLRNIQPHYYCKGGDYDLNDSKKWPELTVCKELGITVKSIPLRPKVSTSNLVKSIIIKEAKFK